VDELLSEFLTETAENLQALDVELVKFERNPADREILGNIFRLVHTIKGTCGFLGLPRLEAVAHAGENVLGRFRDGDLPVTPAAVSLILACIDTIRGLLDELGRTGQEKEGDDSALISQLNGLAEGRLPVDAVGDATRIPYEGANGGSQTSDYPVAAELIAEVAAARARGIQAASDEQIAAELEAEREAERRAVLSGPGCWAAPVPAGAEGGLVGQAAAADSGTTAAAEKVVQPLGQSIRVPVETLETLMTLVSELVITRNQLLQMVRGRDDSEFVVPLQRLNHITSDLQDGVMKTRMQPIGNAWAKLPRIVRDLALETGKKLDLKMVGAETELDRQVLELIKDPLTHMVRNSADHGIEMPDERQRAGKPETGTITLNAFHEGGHIIIVIRDDGRGLDTDRIREKAIKTGLASAAELASMSTQEIHRLIFRPGFSTAQAVTSISGRGVGMDVVRTNIEKIGGTVEVDSVPGRGSTFVIKIPLTLAIVSALIISAGGLRFAIPQICVVELVRATNEGETRIEFIKGTPLLRLRDRLLPLVDLRKLLRLDKHEDCKAEHGSSHGQPRGGETSAFVIVTQVGNMCFGIIVDEVFDTEEIVVKPVAPALRSISYFAGNTILGDGSVVMILDPNGIAAVTGQSRAQTTAEAAAATTSAGRKRRSLLIFRATEEDLKAVPLELVTRIERFERTQVEQSQGRPVIQYRGCLMPLIPCSATYEWQKEESYPVLVFADRERSMGLVVAEILDIVEDYLEVEIAADREGLIGSAIINGKATDIIDAGHFLTQAFPDWFTTNGGAAFGGGLGNARLLLVDDSSFFRGLLTPILEAAGFDVVAVDNAAQALDMREQGQCFDVIVSDIEMPGMNGFDFARAVRSDRRWREVPLVAMSSYASSKDLDRGHAAGFTDYVAKFDRDGLLQSLSRTRAQTAVAVQ
jgi:two-component system chemotaxis sensor kinase CheA